MPEETSYFATPPLPETYSFAVVGLKEAERIYGGERPNTEELVSNCDSCTKLIQKAREKGLEAKVVIEINTRHLVNLL